jgi:uncharacterized protein YndB with AHSA1/START domain
MSTPHSGIQMTIDRVIPASPAEVFDAFTDPEAQKIWFQLLSDEPGIVEIEVDLRAGGRWTNTWGPSRDELYREVNILEVVDPPHRIVMRSSITLPDGVTMDTLVEVTFEDSNGKTLMTVTQSGLASEDVKDFVVNTAWPGMFDRLTAYFEMGFAASS